MEIILNDKSEILEEEMTISELFDFLSLGEGRGVAVAVNQAVVPRNQWDVIKLRENDSVLMVTATQGG